MKIVDFVNEMKEKATEGLVAVSGDGKRVEKNYQFEVGTADVVTVRGGSIEKAVITHLVLKC
ncbi:MAG: hypothetical protein JRF49_05445, partial [Deltaproteobacteria bacterium]|nr:hypothetical protein [Deltaproteobacteria bacterium]